MSLNDVVTVSYTQNSNISFVIFSNNIWYLYINIIYIIDIYYLL